MRRTRAHDTCQRGYHGQYEFVIIGSQSMLGTVRLKRYFRRRRMMPYGLTICTSGTGQQKKRARLSAYQQPPFHFLQAQKKNLPKLTCKVGTNPVCSRKVRFLRY
ncbi:hypothetical protein Tbd_1343 [Thiobacillus denitrificans ATCC 25259]|uniref:Uncharacterized protein n=1 Tax=Thiobacillus denitrificans (strain ATCC 25259 / T1) TaxID=292415 RepID=Q3SJ71_THIDA|nr:hypothetical protein Tbd_1343 [Thiobacillus denitrificans ATCC 25259]